MRFNARQLKAAKEEAVESARRRHRLGGRRRFVFGLALGVVVGLSFSYLCPDAVKYTGDKVAGAWDRIAWQPAVKTE